MKTIEEKARAYDEAIKKAAALYKASEPMSGCNVIIETLFPKLKESEDERIRKWCISHFKECINVIKDNDEYKEYLSNKVLAWLERQGEHANFRNKIQVGDKVTRNEAGVLINLSQLNRVAKKNEKQCETFPVLSNSSNIGKDEHKPNDKVEQRFKVKYAGSEYNVLEVKDIAGVTFYGIEDEPNHIDYVKEENCEIISGYAIKENGSPYPTKPAVFSGKEPAAWSEEDEELLKWSINNLTELKDRFGEEYGKVGKCIDWVKSLRPQNNITDEELAQAKKDAYNNALDKIEYHSGEPTFDDGWSAAIWYLKKKNAMPQTQWKPSDNELEVLRLVAEKDGTCLMGLYEQLKKL